MLLCYSIRMRYKACFFDLYGTLVDLETNERKMPLWRLLSDFYRVYGCRWKVKELRDTFFDVDTTHWTDLLAFPTTSAMVDIARWLRLEETRRGIVGLQWSIVTFRMRIARNRECG